ncbi:MAG: site-2 protease family protein [Spirochaetia bacterium]|jgi:Zn-dependent protease|nr:site-2 protease family protein [Spirochaetia bacterium]
MLLNLPLQQLLILIPILLLSLSVHELSHGLVSTFLGDSTPRMEGRLTLNPLRHLDLYGTIMLLVAGFGWAKPVRININSYKNKYSGLVLTSMAGPLSNLLIALLFAFFLRIIVLSETLSFLQTDSIINIIQYVMIINILLFVFNMIPIPPLDGSRIVTAVFKGKGNFIKNYNRYGVFILLALLLMNRFFNVDILPISRMMGSILRVMISLVLPELAG